MNWKRNLREYRTRGFYGYIDLLWLESYSRCNCFHTFEYCKVVVTTLQGDNTPKQKGKMLPNPLKFVEPIGFLIYVFTGYGWSNPAETSPFMYKNRKVGNLLTYGSPIVLCIVLGKILALISELCQMQ